MSMGEWRFLTIGDLCDMGLARLQTGPFGAQLHAYDYTPVGVPVVPTEAISNRQIDHSVLPKISPEKAGELERHRLLRGDILFARRGVQATGRSAYIRDAEEGFICGTGAIRLRVSRKNGQIDAEFLSHVLATKESVDWFKFHAIGATMPNLNEGIIRSFSFQVPEMEQQCAIAALLSALDDRIDLNGRMNVTIEAMARAIFKDWFVDFGPTRAKAERREPYLGPELWTLFPSSLDDDDRPARWGYGCLSQVAESRRDGVNPAESRPDTPYIGLEHMPRRLIALSDWDYAEKVTSNKSLFKKGEFLFGKLRPYFHKVGVAPVDGICSTDIVVVKPSAPAWSGFVLACISSDDFVAHTDRTSTGTKMPRTSWKEMGRYEFCLPPVEVAEAYQRIVGPMVDRIIANIHESRTLAQLRDLLLPKLMSGEIRLRDAEKMVEAAA